MAIPKPVTFPSRGVAVAANLYLPPLGAPDRLSAAIAIGHPMTGVKEQTAGLHACQLADSGFIALAWDAAYQGESGGQPRGLEDPIQRAEDARAAVTYLSTLTEVDPARIGALGICASGGYVPFAAQTDVRMRAVACLSGVDVGRLTREGIIDPKTGGKPVVNRDMLDAGLIQAAADRVAEAKGSTPATIQLLPEPGHIADGTPELFCEAAYYYRTPCGAHPRSDGLMLRRNADLMANFDAYRFNHLISPRPLLMIVGETADTRYFSEDGIKTAAEPKELFVVPGKTHVALYNDTSVTMPKLIEFFTKELCA